MELTVWLRAVSALAFVGLLLMALYWALRMLSQGRLLTIGRSKLVSVIESTVLGQHVSVHVVKMGSRYLLLGASSGHVSLIAEMPPEEVEPFIEAQRQSLSLQTARLTAVFKKRQ